MSGRSRVLVTLVALAAVGGSLVACSSGPGTPGTLPATSPPATSAPQSPSPSTWESDQQAIEAAVRAYFDGMDQAVKTGDVDVFLAATSTSCPCRQFAQSVEAKFETGRLVGASVALDKVDVKRPTSERAVAGVTYRTSAYEEIAGNGSSKSFEASDVQSSLVLVRDGSGWVVGIERVLERS